MRPFAPFPGRSDEDDPRAGHRSIRRESFLGWATARTGLRLGMVGAIFMSVGMLGLLWSVVSRPPGGIAPLREPDKLAEVFQTLTALALVAGAACYLVSLFLTSGAPPESGGAAWSAALRIAVVALLLLVTAAQVGAFKGSREGRQTFLVLLYALSAIIFSCWCMYLRAVASYVGCRGTAVALVALLVVGLLSLGANVLLAISDVPTMSGSNSTIVQALVAVGLLIWQAIALGIVGTSLTDLLLKRLRDV